MAIPRIGPPGSGKIAVAGNKGTTAWANVFWVNLAGGTTATQANWDAYVSAFGEQYFTQLSSELSPAVQVTSATGVLFRAPNDVLHSVHTMAHAGTSAGAFMDATSLCWVISWTSNAYWKGGKPRTYIPGMKTTDTSDGHTLNAAADTRLTTKANDLHVAINALSAPGLTNTQHGFVKFIQQGVVLQPGVFYAISGGQIHPRMGTQRRRLGKWVP